MKRLLLAGTFLLAAAAVGALWILASIQLRQEGCEKYAAALRGALSGPRPIFSTSATRELGELLPPAEPRMEDLSGTDRRVIKEARSRYLAQFDRGFERQLAQGVDIILTGPTLPPGEPSIDQAKLSQLSSDQWDHVSYQAIRSAQINLEIEWQKFVRDYDSEALARRGCA